MRTRPDPRLALLALTLTGSVTAVRGQGGISADAIVRKDATTARYCPEVGEGEVCPMTLPQALAHCRSQGGRLASTRDFARYMNLDAILETSQVVDGKAPEGYYLVACVDEHGQKDAFYFNNERGRNGGEPRVLTGDLARFSFWTSSLVLDHTDFAHVFYGPLGGGGGTPEDHHRDRRHGVVLLED